MMHVTVLMALGAGWLTAVGMVAVAAPAAVEFTTLLDFRRKKAQ
jgi:hypothetical protein